MKIMHGSVGIGNFMPLTMQCLVSSEQTCAVKGRTIKDNLHFIRTIIEKVNEEASLIPLDQAMAFDRVDRRFLETVLSAAGFETNLWFWICFLYSTSVVMLEVNPNPSVYSDPFVRALPSCSFSMCLHLSSGGD